MRICLCDIDIGAMQIVLLYHDMMRSSGPPYSSLFFHLSIPNNQARTS